MGAARSPGGLRGELTEFIGRRAELAQVRDALAGARLVTLTRAHQDEALGAPGGQSNGQIAASLVISVRTVETHVQHIMDKLGCGSRAQIAAWSAARSPVA